MESPTSNLPRVAVIIPAFNAAKYLRRAVESVWRTGYPSIEVAIVDDGSTDETSQIAEEICAEAPKQCTLYRHPNGGNHGVSASRNLGIARTTGEWVAFLDADDTYTNTRFDCLHVDKPNNQTSHLSNHHLSNVDGFYGVAAIVLEDYSYPPDENFWRQNNLFGISTPLCGIQLLKHLLTGVTWPISAITLRRSLLEKTGGFDISKNIAEDCDLWFRLVTVGKIMPDNLSSPISYYHRHSSNTYHYKIEHRLAMVNAMLDSWHWAKSIGVHPDYVRVFSNCVPEYAYNSIVAAREADRPDVAWSILGLMAMSRKLGFFLKIRTLKQWRALILSTQVGDFFASGNR